MPRGLRGAGARGVCAEGAGSRARAGAEKKDARHDGEARGGGLRRGVQGGLQRSERCVRHQEAQNGERTTHEIVLKLHARGGFGHPGI